MTEDNTSGSSGTPPEKPQRTMFSRFVPKSPKDAIQPVAAPPPPPAVQLRKSPFVTFASNFFTVLLLVAALSAAGAYFVTQKFSEPGPLTGDRVLMVQGGVWDIAEQLQREGIINNQYVFLASVLTSGNAGALKKGEYQFPQHASVQSVMQTLVEGRAISHSITIPEGLTSEQAVARIVANDVLVGDVREIPREGSLMPDTYKFERGMSRERLVASMQAAQRKALAEIWAKRASDLPIRTPQELVTLASVIEKETGRADERSRVASVFVNRLNRKMRLQSDPTIVYGLVGGKGTLGRGITKSELERATPYNTYVVEGLPPGPIANPGRAALEAAANPSRTRDLYFVADGTGGHVFAESLDQHNRNVQRWRQIERAKAPSDQQPQPVDRVDAPDDPAPRPQRGTNLMPGGDPTVQPSAFAPADQAGADGDQPAQSGARSGTAQLAPGRSRSPVVDAVEGRALDPLRAKNYDLNSPKTVPILRN